MREAVKIRKAEEANALGEVALRDVSPSLRDFHFAVMTRRSYVVLVAGIVRRDLAAQFERWDLDPAALAEAAERAGAAALAVGTDGQLFGGSLDALHAIAPARRLPVLRLDYVLDPRQILASRLAGADAVLVSAGMLEAPHLERLVQSARAMHVQVVLEVRDEADLARAGPVPGAIIGVGDLTGETGVWDAGRVLALAARVPPRATLLALGGCWSADDVARFTGHVDAALVTAGWLSADDPVAAAAAVFG